VVDAVLLGAVDREGGQFGWVEEADLDGLAREYFLLR
jgi:hypothetical protein